VTGTSGRVSPAGTEEAVRLPSPSEPLSLAPQHFTVPSPGRAHACSPLTAICGEGFPAGLADADADTSGEALARTLEVADGEAVLHALSARTSASAPPAKVQRHF
jgi:hypothetical protein